MMSGKRQSRRVLAVSSGGGHWIQLLRLAPAFRGHEVTYAYAGAGTPTGLGGSDLIRLPDANKSRPDRVLRLLWAALGAVWKVRPDVVISTGAAPGLVTVAVARMFGAKTMFIDSLANAERLSLSGRLAKRLAHRVLTQWRHLADSRGPSFCGAVL